MAFYVSRRKLKPRADESGELNLVPYLDILMNLIIFLLMSITGLAAFGILNVNAPNYGGPAASAGDSDKPQLVLSVLVSKKGFFIAGAGGILGQQGEDPAQVGTAGAPTVPMRADGSYDFAKLTDQLKQIKAHPDFQAQTKVIIGAEADVAYEHLIGTMDAVRETKERAVLFPDVTLAAM